MVVLSVFSAILLGRGNELAAAVPAGAQAGITLAVSMAGSICLWTGVGKLMEKIGFTDTLAGMLRPLLRRLFPGTGRDPALARDLSANISANFMSPIFFMDNVDIETTTVELGNKSFTLLQRAIDSESKMVKCECRTVMVVYDLKTQTPMQMPEEYKIAICEYEGRTLDELGKKK
jgi:spore maturation protein SpmA